MGINSGTSFLIIFAKRPFTKVLIAAYQVVNRASVLLSGLNQGDNYKKKKSYEERQRKSFETKTKGCQKVCQILLSKTMGSNLFTKY